jgi:hypothetical protein
MPEGDSQAERPRDRPPPLRPPRLLRDIDEDELEDQDGIRRDTVEAIIPYRNPRALAAYYCGVFGLVPLAGLLLGPAALGLGFVGFRHSRHYPDSGGTRHAVAGIVLGTLDIAVGVLTIAVGWWLYEARR